MRRHYSMPEYYQLQGMLAKKYNIVDFHAGCHITHYKNESLCAKCARKDKCAEIYEQERNSDIYTKGVASVKEE